MKFRDLTKDEIECRVGMVGKTGNGLSLLLYKDARCDMRILDEAVGAENWQREHYECKGNLFCRVGIRYPIETEMLRSGFSSETEKCIEWSDWVWKADCGTESNTEKEKGEASDSFKRACVNWGIGRELYTAPFIWVKAEDCNIKQEKSRNGEEWKCRDNFSVEKIKIEKGEITGLAIWNDTKKCRAFVYVKEEKKDA